jgi:phosphoglycerate kinase
MQKMNKLSELTDNQLAGKTVFVRGGLNAPIEEKKITTDFRLQRVLPTLNHLQKAGAKVILAGHLSGSDTDSFRIVHEYLNQEMPLDFITDYAEGRARQAVESMERGDIVLFENLRQHDGEKANDKRFAQMLAGYADIYVNEAFPAAHREHASIVGVPQFLPSYAGLQFEREIAYLSRAFDPEHPFVFILGGAKFSTKIPLVRKFLSLADDVFVGGAIANAYLQARGNIVGRSQLPDKKMELDDALSSTSLHLPDDVVCEDKSHNSTRKSVDDVQPDDTIVDAGPEFSEEIKNAINVSEMVVWNSPMRWYEKFYTE